MHGNDGGTICPSELELSSHASQKIAEDYVRNKLLLAMEFGTLTRLWLGNCNSRRLLYPQRPRHLALVVNDLPGSHCRAHPSPDPRSESRGMLSAAANSPIPGKVFCWFEHPPRKNLFGDQSIPI